MANNKFSIWADKIFIDFFILFFKNFFIYYIPQILHWTEPRALIDIYLMIVTGLQINLYLEQPMEIQLFVTFFPRRKWHKKRLTF
jgi:hypothetical protein